MLYTDVFRRMLEKKENVRSKKVFMFQNKRSCNMKVLPPEVGFELFGECFKYLQSAVEGKEFIDFVPNEIRDDALQVIDIKYLGIWDRIIKARHKINADNIQNVETIDYNNLGNTVMMELEFKPGHEGEAETVFFLSVYRNVAEWYRNSIRFVDAVNFPEFFKTKAIKRGGELVRVEGEILAFTPNVDAVIYGDRCYIMDETNFNRIFKFDQVAGRIVEEHRGKLLNLNFIFNGQALLDGIAKSTRLKKEMAKAIMSGRIESISACDPPKIRQRINARAELNGIIKFEQNRIIVNEKNCKVVVGILSGRINLDLITNHVNGMG